MVGSARRETGVIVRPLSSYQIEPIRWLWKHWLAKGKLHILAGQGGGAKSTLALKMIATITTGGLWPDGTVSPQGHALIWSGEDAVSDTLMPRLIAMGGDPDRVHIVHATNDEAGPRQFNPALDMPKLGPAIERMKDDLSLLVLDPVSAAYVGDSHKDAEVRASLQPVINLAERFDVAMLGIAHFAKNSSGRLPVERVMGSAAIGNAPRLVMGVARPNDPRAPRVLARVKSNIGPDGGGFEYQLVQTLLRKDEADDEGIPTQMIEWGKFLDGSARDLFKIEEPVKEDALADAVDFLADFLVRGPIKVADVKEAAAAYGHSWRTCERAKDALKLVVSHPAIPGPWFWALPPASTPGQDRQGRQG